MKNGVLAGDSKEKSGGRRSFYLVPNSGLSFPEDWQSFYRDVFDLRVDLAGLAIPNKLTGFDRLLVIAGGLGLWRIYGRCEALFPCYKWTDDNLGLVVRSERVARQKDYAVWVRDRVEADEELKNFSAYDLKQQKISSITLEERLIYELKYFQETRQHLDIQNITLCAGSAAPSGVVHVGFYDGMMKVRCCHLLNHNPDLRSRQVVC